MLISWLACNGINYDWLYMLIFCIYLTLLINYSTSSLLMFSLKSYNSFNCSSCSKTQQALKNGKMNGITLLFQWAVWRLDCHKLYISYPVISIFSFALFEGKSFHFITRSLKLITQANIYSEKDTIPRILQKKLFSKYFPSRIKPIRRIPEALISTNTMEICWCTCSCIPIVSKLSLNP